jgi:hypothetical protein
MGLPVELAKMIMCRLVDYQPKIGFNPCTKTTQEKTWETMRYGRRATSLQAETAHTLRLLSPVNQMEIRNP